MLTSGVSMPVRLLITSGGTGPTESLLRSLRRADPGLFIATCHDDVFVLKKSAGAGLYLTPPPQHAGFVDALHRIVEADGFDLVVPNSDPDVAAVSEARETIGTRVFLPRKDTIRLCQDKYALSAYLLDRHLPAPRSCAVTDEASIAEAFRVLAPAPTLWCRTRTGTGSRGAIPVRTPQQALSWIEYWRTMRGVPFTEFMLSEYLPGRDFTCESLWKDGVLIVVKTAERLSYFGGAERPSGTSSNAALAKTVVEPDVVRVSTSVVRALDPHATGVFSIDLKADDRGMPSVTEINIGRVFSTTSLFDLVGKHNMAHLYVRLALDEPVDVVDDDVVPDYYFVRHIDTLPDIVHADDVFEGIIDARS